MGNHAILSASSSHRWLNCLPSARLELEFEDQSGEAAKEGTAAHDLCEHKLKKALLLTTLFDLKLVALFGQEGQEVLPSRFS